MQLLKFITILCAGLFITINIQPVEIVQDTKKALALIDQISRFKDNLEQTKLLLNPLKQSIMCLKGQGLSCNNQTNEQKLALVMQNLKALLKSFTPTLLGAVRSDKLEAGTVLLMTDLISTIAPGTAEPSSKPLNTVATKDKLKTATTRLHKHVAGLTIKLHNVLEGLDILTASLDPHKNPNPTSIEETPLFLDEDSTFEW